MHVIFTDHGIPLEKQPAIFLAGPTPRDQKTQSWRPEALQILSSLGFRGQVYIPEWHNWEAKCDYMSQVDWEKYGLTNANVIAFWVPRTADSMPAFTTNVEFGYWLAKDSDRVLYGRPDKSFNNHYLDWLYRDHSKREPFNCLEKLLQQAVSQL